jgi:hypothetical protein
MIIFLSSCKVYLNEGTRQRIQTNGTEKIEEVQFYNDREIKLVYKTVSTDEKISGGKVKLKDGYYYYYITIPKKTPALAEHLNERQIKVYFEQGVDRFLVFECFDRSNMGAYYQLSGKKTNDGFYVTFEGKSMKVIEGASALLLMRKNVNVKVKKESRTVKGMKL